MLRQHSHGNWTVGETDRDVVRALSWNHDGTQLAGGGRDGVIYIWDADAGDFITTLTGHTDNVRHLTWSSDGTRLATAGDDGSLRLWNAVDGSEIKLLDTSPNSFGEVAWHPRDERLLRACIEITSRFKV